MTATRRPARMHPRLRDRRRAVASAWRRRRRRRALALACVAALAVAGVAVARSPWLAVAEIEVRGVDGERAAEVRERVVEARGTPLASVDRRARVAEITALPWVRDAALRRRLPHRLVAEVTPREPIALIEADGGRWQVDADGVVVAPADESGDLLPIDGGDAAVVPPGERLRDDTLRQAVAVVDGLPPDLAADVTAVHASRPRALALQLEAGPLARLGSAERLEAKLDALGLVLADLADREDGDLAGVAEIDVRVPETPTVQRHEGDDAAADA